MAYAWQDGLGGGEETSLTRPRRGGADPGPLFFVSIECPIQGPETRARRSKELRTKEESNRSPSGSRKRMVMEAFPTGVETDGYVPTEASCKSSAHSCPLEIWAESLPVGTHQANREGERLRGPSLALWRTFSTLPTWWCMAKREQR